MAGLAVKGEGQDFGAAGLRAGRLPTAVRANCSAALPEPIKRV
jgi:hypothetical protein